MNYLKYLLISLIVIACREVKNQHGLPIYGHHEYNGTDTIYYKVGNFQVTNQDNAMVTNETFKDRIYVADFFFTSCPTICPVMKTQLLRVYEKIEKDTDVSILSYTIDPAHDTVELLEQFANNLGVKTPQWHFVTGEKDSIYAVAQTYLVLADEEPTAPGGFVHSGAFLLVDKLGRIRGVYDGTVAKEVDLLLDDIDLLRKEYE